MKSTPSNTLRYLYLALLSILLFAQAGCSINARQFAWSAYENREPSIDQWAMLKPHTNRTLLLATFASTHYTRSNRLASDDELISSDTPVILAWIEFKAVDQPIPLYRYVIQPLKAITAEELLRQGKYISNNTHRLNNLPARTPATVTNGAVVTDWQYCYDCFSSRPLDELSPASVAYFREEMDRTTESKPLDRLIFVNDPRKAPSFKSRASLQVYSGDEAERQQGLLAERVAELGGAIADAKNYDAQYREFTNTEHKPLTFAYSASKAGCPTAIANPREIRGDRRSSSNTIIRVNVNYIECNSKVLESYDLAPYQTAYEYLLTREKMLWDRSSRQERHQVVRPETTIDYVLESIDAAAKDIESAYKELELADRLDARNQQLDAFSQQNWANTLNSIQARNSSIGTQYQQTQAIIRNAQSSQYKPPARSIHTHSSEQAATPAIASRSAPEPGNTVSAPKSTKQPTSNGAQPGSRSATPPTGEDQSAVTSAAAPAADITAHAKVAGAQVNAKVATTSTTEDASPTPPRRSYEAGTSAPTLGFTPDAQGCWNGQHTQGSCLEYRTHEKDGKTYFELTNVCSERLYMKWCADKLCGADSLRAGETKTKSEFVSQASIMARAVGSTMPGSDWVCAGRVADWYQ